VRGLKLLLVLLAVLLAWLQYRLWFGEGGTRSVTALGQHLVGGGVDLALPLARLAAREVQDFDTVTEGREGWGQPMSMSLPHARLRDHEDSMGFSGNEFR